MCFFQHCFIPELSLLLRQVDLAAPSPPSFNTLLSPFTEPARHGDVILHSVQAVCSYGMQDDRSGTSKNNLFICRNFITKMLTKYELFHSPFLLPATSFSGFFLLLLIVVICACVHTAFSSPRFWWKTFRRLFQFTSA